MQRMSLLLCLLGGCLITSAGAQSTSRCQPPTTPAASVAGGLVHGTVKAGNVPLPGVSVVATNTLTGQRYATITDINGNYSMTIPISGRYVIRTELAAFAPETKVALLKPTPGSPISQQADFALTLASRVAPESLRRRTWLDPPGRQQGTVRRNTGSRSAESGLACRACRHGGRRHQQRSNRSSPAFHGE